MHELVVVNDEQKAVTTSLKVAEYFGKEHKHVLRDIQRLDCSKKFHRSNFGPMFRTITVGKGATRQSKYYEMTRDGFMFLVMGYTGVLAARIKEAFIEAFNMMEDKVRALTLDERKQVTDLLRANSTMLIEQDNLIKELTPKAEVHDRTMDLGDSMTMTSAAKLQGIKR
jgi:Rha family phage regulatory protein